MQNAIYIIHKLNKNDENLRFRQNPKYTFHLEPYCFNERDGSGEKIWPVQLK